MGQKSLSESPYDREHVSLELQRRPNEEEPDETLMARYAAGDPGAFEELASPERHAKILVEPWR